MSQGAYIHLYDDLAVMGASENGHLEVDKYLDKHEIFGGKIRDFYRQQRE